MDANITKHPKIRKLVKILRCSKLEAIGALAALWGWGMTNARKDGELIETDEDDLLEIYVGLTKLSEEKIVSALFEAGLLERVGDSIFIHDWKEHQRYWYSHKEKKERDQDRYKRNKGKSAQEDDDVQIEIEGLDEPEEAPPPEPPKEEIPPDEQTTGKKPKESKYTKKFNALWDEYPFKRGTKESAFRAYLARCREGYTYDQLLLATRNYASQVKKEGTEERYVKHGSTFFGPDKHFKNYLPKGDEEAKAEPTLDGDSNPFAKYMEDI